MKKQSKKASVNETGRIYNASAARRNFFSILGSVAAGGLSTPVIVRHKDLPDDIAMVNATALRESQMLIKSLLKGSGPSKKFKLSGSMTLNGDVEEVLAEVRRENAQQLQRRLAEF